MVTYNFSLWPWPTTVGGRYGRRTLFEIKRYVTLLWDATNTHSEDAVCIAVAGTTIFLPSTIAASPDKYRAFTIAPL